ncbi:sodium-dependent lysophosphatidylcholine symporter 1-like [Ostrea edulis]|uniref:sodium-dependent lysophosphatidylcholine symporter 1-like n=1 Tax=Ostrea edulis TaxID=37623 RepID=UPI0024AEA3B9|nr:sodium-dependent lysophosphatidylcholine symporter 1-like [Ostrea edulis]
MEPNFDLHAYEPPISLWSIVEQYIPVHEHEEIKGMLGESLVDQSQELRIEIDTLLDIWRDYRDETNENSKEKLPEPPGLRDRLVQEIQFFIENVKEKSKLQGMDPERILTTGHNAAVIDYAMEVNRPNSARGSRPSTAMSREGRDTPMICTPTGSDKASFASTLSEEIESMTDKLNYLKFDEVVHHLKSYLEDEISTLLKDIQFLYECLDEEATYRAEIHGTFSREPTIAELQTERSKMEKEMLSNNILPQPPVMRPSPFNSLKKFSSPQVSSFKIKNTNPKSGSSPPGRANSPTGTRTDNACEKVNPKSRPLKVSRDLSGKITDKLSGPHGDMNKQGLVGMVKVNPPTLKTSSVVSSSPHVVAPPSSGKPVRPSSADRFRRMGEQQALLSESGVAPSRLPVWRKLCYAVGGPPYQITNTVINFFLSIFLLEVAEIRPSYVAIIVFGGKVWDAITDPLCGYFVNNTRSRFGQFKPWILLSTPLACTAYFFLWYVPDFNEEAKLAWYFIFYCLFQGFLSGIHVPYTSLTMYISKNQRERDSATAYRMVFEALGVLMAATVQGVFVNSTRVAGNCEKDGDETVTATPEQLNDEKWSYIEGTIVVICVYSVCAVVCVLGTKECDDVIDGRQGGFLTGLRAVLTFKPYIRLYTCFLFQSLAIAIVQGNLALFCTHSLDLGDYFSTFIIILLVSSIVSMPIWQMLLKKFGKKSTFAAGMILFIPILISQLYIDDNIYLYIPILVLGGFSIAVALLLPWSMLPDVLDEFMLVTGERKDAIFYSFYVFFNKLAAGLGLGLSQVALQLGGYKSGACEQSKDVDLALRLLVVPGPVVFVLIALLFLWAYPIDEDRRMYNKKRLEEMRENNERKPDSPIPPDEYIKDQSLSYESVIVTSTEI